MNGSHNTEMTFSEKVTSYIVERNVKNSVLYKRAEITRSVFSDMSQKYYIPSFKTAVKVALALSLSIQDTNDLLSRARMALSPCFVFDRVIMEFLKQPSFSSQNYDLSVLDAMLLEKGEETLFSEL